MEMEKEDILVNQTQQKKIKTLENERNFLRKAILLSGLITILTFTFTFIIYFQKNYFIIQPDGRIEKLVQKETKLTYDKLYAFADTVIINTFNYSYVNINGLFDRNALYYTTVGLANLKKAFEDSNTIIYTKQFKVTKTTVATNQIYKVVPAKIGINIYRSYYSEEITKNERKIYPTVIYEINVIKETKADGYLYELKVNSIKELSLKQYREKFPL